jgi:hypothetical protein
LDGDVEGTVDGVDGEVEVGDGVELVGVGFVGSFLYFISHDGALFEWNGLVLEGDDYFADNSVVSFDGD